MLWACRKLVTCDKVVPCRSPFTLLFEHTGSSRVSVGESSRPKGASLEQELIFRRHASSVRSQTGNMDDVVITVNGKHFSFIYKFND